MNALWLALERLLRGPWARRRLQHFGIDPVHYWLLMDLFGELSERREVFSQLGRDAISIKKAAWMYLIFSGLMALPLVLAGASPSTYLLVFLAITAFLLLSLLLPETSNSLLNPVEGLVLAHQPIDGATYTAAKLSHLLRIVLYLVPSISTIPAFAGLFLKGAPWYYPLLHLSLALILGLVLALLCCALFGWLMRFVAPARLKAVGFAAEMMPWVLYLLFQIVRPSRKSFVIPGWIPTHGAPLVILVSAWGVVAVAAVILGIRALSGDYLARVAAIAHGGSGKKTEPRRSRLGVLVARWMGGPPAHAGFAYAALMMRRDWQFRRQLLPLIPMAVMPFLALAQGVGRSPFTGTFTWMHVFPHAIGIAFYVICSVMVFGSDHKGAWLFLLAPGGAFRAFAAGVWARLLSLVVFAHIIVLAVLAWEWGIRDAVLFTVYSMAVASIYVGLEMRLIEGMPFARQPETTANPYIFVMMAAGGLAMAAVVGIQHFLIFHSPVAVMAATVVLCAVSWMATRTSLDAFNGNIRFHLATLSSEAKAIYTEVN